MAHSRRIFTLLTLLALASLAPAALKADSLVGSHSGTPASAAVASGDACVLRSVCTLIGAASGNAVSFNSRSAAFIPAPTPEPSSIWLLVAGLILFAWYWRRQRVQVRNQI